MQVDSNIRMLGDVGRERGLWVALAVGAMARLVLALLSDQFFIVPLQWQLLDTKLLREEPLVSLYYLHMQPPLHNALLAVALALPGNVESWALGTLFLGLSFPAIAIVYFFLRRWLFSALAASALAALFGLMPQILIYEKVFIYAHLEATLALFAMYFAATYGVMHRTGSFVAFATCLTILALVRSVFHLAWVAVALVTVWWAAGSYRLHNHRSAVAAAVSLLLVLAVYAKNYREFGVFVASSWQGISMAVMSLPNSTDDKNFPEIVADAKQRVARGELSPAFGLYFENSWDGFMQWAEEACRAIDRPAALCAQRHSSNAQLNYNHLAMIRFSRELGADFWTGLRLYPELFLFKVALGALLFVGRPSWDYWTNGNSVLLRYSGLWDALLLYEPGRLYKGDRPAVSRFERVLNRVLSISLPLVFMVLVSVSFVFIKGTVGLWRVWRGEPADLDWIFPALVVALFVTVPILLNGIETNRIRYTIEPILFLAFAIGVRDFSRALRRRLRQR